MAQLVARLVRNEKVWGSNPHSSTEMNTDSHPDKIFVRVAVCMRICRTLCFEEPPQRSEDGEVPMAPTREARAEPRLWRRRAKRVSSPGSAAAYLLLMSPPMESLMPSRAEVLLMTYQLGPARMASSPVSLPVASVMAFLAALSPS